ATARGPTGCQLHFSLQCLSKVVARICIALIARVSQTDLRPPELDLTAQRLYLAREELDVLLIRVELGLEPLHARRVANHPVCRPLAEHPPQTIDGGVQRVDLR